MTDEAKTSSESSPPEKGGGGVPGLDTLSGIWKVTVDRPVATLMVVVAVAVFGYLSYGQLAVALMPELSYPTLTVRTQYSGAAPEEIEEEVTKPLEEMLRTVEGILSVQSSSRAGMSDVILRFRWDTDMDFASQRVRERIDVLPLPDESERPLLLRYDPSLDPVLRLGVHGEMDLAKLRTFAEDEVALELEKIKGVAMVSVRGGREEIVRVDLDQERMTQAGIRVADVEQRLAAENVNLAGGQLKDGDVEYLVRTLNEFRDIGELEQMVVVRKSGRTIRLKDVGRVYLDFKDREVVTHIDGRESVEIAIYKEADANLVSVSAAVVDKLYGTAAQKKFVEEEANKKDGATDEGFGAGNKPVDDKMRKAMERQKELQRRNMTDFVTFGMPKDVEVSVLSNQAMFIEDAVDEVTSTALLGALFAVFILYVFLRNSYTTGIIALAIPLSIVFTFAPMRLLDVSVNIMSLGGLALGIGMLVDNSIVVLESIHRCREEGDGRRQSAIRGTQEVGSAVIASTLTTIAVFLPMVFIEGVAGQLFGDLALTVVISLLASLVVALFVVPTLASRKLELATDREGGGWRVRLRFATLHGAREDAVAMADTWRRRKTWLNLVLLPITVLLAAYTLIRVLVTFVLELIFSKVLMGLALLLAIALRWIVVGVGWALRMLLTPVTWSVSALLGGLAKVYPTALRGAIRHPVAVLAGAGAVFALSLWLMEQVGMELIPDLHQSEFNVEISMPIGMSLHETTQEVTAIEGAISKLDLVQSHSSFIGAETTSIADADRGEHTATINVILESSRDLEATEALVMAELRGILGKRPGLTYELARPKLFTLETPVAVEVRGHSLPLLKSTADRVAEQLESMPELADVRSNLSSGYPEVQITFDRELLAAQGLKVRDVAEAVQRRVKGTVPSEYHNGERRLDIELRVRRDQVQSVEQLRSLVIGYRDTGGGNTAALLAAGGNLQAAAGASGSTTRPVTLGSVANVNVSEGPSEIRHIDGQRAAVVKANSPFVDLQSVIESISNRLASLPLPEGITLSVGGQNQELESARRSLFFALLLAIFLVYIVMASQFESVLAPFVIIFTIPLALVGVAAALWIVSSPLSVVVFIGLIMLTGIVVNNAIVLVDYIIQLRDRGRPHVDAIVEACTIRLRPVLITTLTTVLGLVPMAIGLGEGAEMRRPMALTVIAGLTSSTLLTLLVIPVVYSLVARGRVARREV